MRFGTPVQTLTQGALQSLCCVWITRRNSRPARRPSRCAVYWYKSTCFTGTKVPILTPEELLQAAAEAEAARVAAEAAAAEGADAA